MSKLADYDAIVIEAPQVRLGCECDSNADAQIDMFALSTYVRDTVIDTAVSERYYIVDGPGVGVLQMRFVITDLGLKFRKPGLLAWSSRHWLNTREDLRTTMRKYEITQLKLHGNLQDSCNRNTLASLTVLRGAAGRPLSFKLMGEDIERFASRLLRRLDNRASSSLPSYCAR